MLNAENIKDAEQRRLAWRCRRGMLELDIILQRFVQLHFDGLTLAQLQAFDEMLELPDNDFWVLVSNQESQPKNADTLTVIKKIRAMQALAESK